MRQAVPAGPLDRDARCCTAGRPLSTGSALGFSVDSLLPQARGGGRLRMGLKALDEGDWLQPAPDLSLRRAAFAAHPGAVATLPEADAAGAELAALRGVAGGIGAAAQTAWEDMCLLLPGAQGEAYRLAAAAVAFPTDWHPTDKLGLPLGALHRPIHGYAEQLATGVDRFMDLLQPGRIFGRCNWFVAPTGAPRWIASELPDHPFEGVTGENAGERLFVRCERQTLRRLPQTGAILFTIGIYTSPLAKLSVPNIARLAEAVATLPPEEAERRGAPAYGAALRAYAAASASMDDIG